MLQALETPTAPVIEAVESQHAELKLELLSSPLPWSDIGRELSLKEDDPIPRSPVHAHRYRDDSHGGARDQPNIDCMGPDETREGGFQKEIKGEVGNRRLGYVMAAKPHITRRGDETRKSCSKKDIGETGNRRLG